MTECDSIPVLVSEELRVSTFWLGWLYLGLDDCFLSLLVWQAEVHKGRHLSHTTICSQKPSICHIYSVGPSLAEVERCLCHDRLEVEREGASDLPRGGYPSEGTRTSLCDLRSSWSKWLRWREMKLRVAGRVHRAGEGEAGQFRARRSCVRVINYSAD